MSKKKVKQGYNPIPLTEEEEESNGKAFFITIVIVLVVLVILMVMIRMDVGGFGSKVLRPIIGDIPVISAVLPPETDEQVAERTGYTSLSQAVTKIEELEREIEELKAKASADAGNASASDEERIKDLEAQLAKYKSYADDQQDFEATKEEFYKEVVYNDNVDVSDYTKWYESMDGDTAAKLYKEAVQTEQATEEQKELAKSYAAMKPDKAAAILENMTADLDIVVNILNSMDEDDRGEIMGEMTPTFAAKVTKKMSS